MVGTEKGAKYYTGETYLISERVKRYLPLYKTVLSFVPDVDSCKRIVDLGCGVGILAKMLHRKGYNNYLGIDFSPMVLAKARKRVPKYNFIRGNITNPKIQKLFSPNDTFVIAEVLEHIVKDVDVIRAIPVGCLTILSVPNFDSASHVRTFNDIEDVEQRYGKILNFIEYKVMYGKGTNKIFIAKSCRK
jgi:2-polyprenyl-3-methyl-5-hydroxy-6-metoxy-1,4-benzoquinol methylase